MCERLLNGMRRKSPPGRSLLLCAVIAHQDVSLETGNGNQSDLPDRPPPIIQTRNILAELPELGTNTTLATSCFVSVDTTPHYPSYPN